MVSWVRSLSAINQLGDPRFKQGESPSRTRTSPTASSCAPAGLRGAGGTGPMCGGGATQIGAGRGRLRPGWASACRESKGRSLIQCAGQGGSRAACGAYFQRSRADGKGRPGIRGLTLSPGMNCSGGARCGGGHNAAHDGQVRAQADGGASPAQGGEGSAGSACARRGANEAVSIGPCARQRC